MTEDQITTTPAIALRSWESRLPGESARWFRRFQRYLLAPGDRSYLDTARSEQLDVEIERYKKRLPVAALDEAALASLEAKVKKKIRTPSGAWMEAVEQFRWDERAAAYDDYQFRVDQAEIARYRSQLRSREREMSKRLGDRAQEMLDHPLTREHKIKDGKVTVVEPSRWTMRDAVAMFEMMSVLGRRGAGMHEVDLLTALDVLIAEGLDPGVLQISEEGYESFRDRVRDALRDKKPAKKEAS